MKKYTVILSESEKSQALDILHKGVHLASKRNRAHILLLSNNGKTDEEIAEVTFTAEKTIHNIRKRFCKEGFQALMEDKKRTGRPKEFDEKDETELIALACSKPPKGALRWTLELLSSKMTNKPKKSTVQLLLKKTNTSLGKIKAGA